MDAFYAAVEIRDNPEMAGKPLIIGALPSERGVVATCSYEARKFGVRSAMSIKDAYRLCPNGIYMHPNGTKYAEVSRQIHRIWSDYTDAVEYISLDEGFLDVTNTEHLFNGASAIAHKIKTRTKDEIRLTCSVGLGYSIMSAKLASEEKKPDGYFEILTPQDLKKLINDRSVRTIYGIGVKTAEQLQRIGITTVRQICESKNAVVALLGNHGKQIIELAEGIDNRKVTPDAEIKSLGTEQTFQSDILDFQYLKDVLRLTADRLSYDIKLKKMYAHTITIKVTYYDMKSITRSKSGDATDRASVIYETAAALLDKIEKKAIRLVGITLSGLTDTPNSQMTIFDFELNPKQEKLDDALMDLRLKYGRKIIKTASVLESEKRLDENTQ